MAEVLPPLYQRWLDELVPAGIQAETRATCASCAMVDRGGPYAPDVPFLPAVKCCTYHPDLPNFLVGRILDDPEMAAGRQVIERRVAARAGVTPAGVSAPAAYQSVYGASAGSRAGVFGRAPSLRCPFYVEASGQCGIWRDREAVCATFFCKHVRGPAGRTFWSVLSAFLKHIETGLRVWCLEELDPGGDVAIATWAAEEGKRGLDESDIAGTMSPEAYARVWGPWVGQERELYRGCARLVAPLGLKDVIEISGAKARAAARVVATLHRRLAQTAAPERVARGANGLVQLGRGPGLVRVRSASSQYDYLDVPAALLDGLTRLVGRPLAPALAALRAEGVALDDATVRALLDFEVLVPA